MMGAQYVGPYWNTRGFPDARPVRCSRCPEVIAMPTRAFGDIRVWPMCPACALRELDDAFHPQRQGPLDVNLVVARAALENAARERHRELAILGN